MNHDISEKPEHLEEIRDIIFGPQKRDFEKRITEIQERIEATKGQFAQMIEALNSSFLDELRSLSHTIDEKLKQVEARDEARRHDLSKHVQEMETRFTASLQSAIQLSAERIAGLDAMLQRTAEAFGEKVSEQERRSTAENASMRERMNEVQSNLAQQLRELHVSLQHHNSDMRQQLNASNERAIETRNEFMKHLSFVEGRFDKSVATAIQTAAEKIGGLDMQMNANHKKLQQEISELRSDVLKALDKRTNELANSKVSRDIMAETLMELAKRFKTDERSDLKLITQSNTTRQQ